MTFTPVVTSVYRIQCICDIIGINYSMLLQSERVFAGFDAQDIATGGMYCGTYRLVGFYIV